MKQTPYAAFGYVVLKNEIDVGEVLNDELIKNNTYSVINPSPTEEGDYGNLGHGYTWLYSSGRMIHTNSESGAVTERCAGWSNLKHPEQVGVFSFQIAEPMVTFCLSPSMNEDRTPRIPVTEYFSLSSGDKVVLPKGTKLFLCSGRLMVSGLEVVGARQVSINSGDKEVIANTDCYGLIFK